MLNLPKTDYEFVERIKVAKNLGLEKDCLKIALDAYKKYPNSLIVIEELLSAFINRTDHSFDKDEEACKIFNECLTKYSLVPEEERKIMIFISPFTMRKN